MKEEGGRLVASPFGEEGGLTHLWKISDRLNMPLFLAELFNLTSMMQF
jgi:hypothetical protein